MIRVSASEFAKNFGRYKEIAQREPVEITSHDRPSGYLISEAEFAHYRKLKARTQQAFFVHELPPDVIEDLINAKMDSKHDYLNAMLEEPAGDDNTAS
jgi:prevent-host-death family protein